MCEVAANLVVLSRALVVEVPGCDVVRRLQELVDGEQPRTKRDHIPVVDPEPSLNQYAVPCGPRSRSRSPSHR